MEYFVEALVKGHILVWLNQNAEIGPRALGNRSLIAATTSMEVKDKLNSIKKRQWWRPVAPLVMDELGDEFFSNYRTSLNMLLNFVVKPEKRDVIPAVIHHDGTARVQSVSNSSNAVLYSLLQAYYSRTGIPLLCNTSLNDAGEPIINTIEEAIEFALHKGLQTVCINGNTVIKLRTDNSQLNLPFSLRNVELFSSSNESDETSFINKVNPFGLNTEELTLYFDNPSTYSCYDLDNPFHVNRIREDAIEYTTKYKNGLMR